MVQNGTALLSFIVKRYNSDFPYPVFAALPLVLATGKTGKVFLWDFVYMAFPEACVVPTTVSLLGQRCGEGCAVFFLCRRHSFPNRVHPVS
jgi:hypothetical protein